MSEIWNPKKKQQMIEKQKNITFLIAHFEFSK